MKYVINQDGSVRDHVNKKDYLDLIDYIHLGLLKFCSCGDRIANLKYVKDSLLYVHNEIPPADMFFFYWADKEGYVTHKYSLPGELSDKGQELVDLIQIALSEE